MAIFKKKKEEQEDIIEMLSRREFIKAETKFRHNNLRKLPRFNKENCVTLGFILETLFDVKKEDLYWLHIFSSNFDRSRVDNRQIDRDCRLMFSI